MHSVNFQNNLKYLNIAAFLIYIISAKSQVVLDSSLRPQIPLTGPNYQITANQGLKIGNNLFHSFSKFNLASTEFAIFSGPPGIDNVISRITDAHPSLINGTVRSTISGADLFLMNPNGLIWGPGSRVNILGSLHISTADRLSLGDKGRFDMNPQNISSLTGDAPSSFEFLDGNSSLIKIQESTFSVPENKSISLLANQIQLSEGRTDIDNGNFRIIGSEPMSRILIQSTQKFGVINQIDDISTSNIEINNHSIMLVNDGIFQVTGHDLLIYNSEISLNSASGNAELLISLTGNLDLNGSLIQSISTHESKSNHLIVNAKEIVIHTGSQLAAFSLDNSAGGEILLNSDSITIDGSRTEYFTGISTENHQNALGFGIIIQTENIDITNGAVISTTTQGIKTGGHIDVTTENLSIDGNDHDFSTGIFTLTTSLTNVGAGGNIKLVSKNLNVLNGGEINAASQGNGNAGNIFIDASQIYLARNNSLLLTGIFAQSEFDTDGRSGTISINTRSLEIRNGALIDNSSYSNNNGGSIKITARELLLSNLTALFNSGILSTSHSQKKDTHGGQISIDTESLKISDGSIISTSTFNQANAGSIDIESDTIVIEDIHMSNKPTGIISLTNHDTQGGTAGNISIFSRSIDIFRGEINASSTGNGDGGNIDIHSDTIRIIGDQSIKFTGISAETQGEINAGTGGQITIISNDLLISDAAAVTVNSWGQGNSGTVIISANTINIQKNHGLFDTGVFAQNHDSSSTGNGGSIQIDALTALTMNRGVISTSAEGDGNAGSMTIRTGSMIIRNESLIDNSNFGTGKAGNIIVNAVNEIHLNNSFISADADHNAGGDIIINSPVFVLENGGAINSTSLGIGKSGDITLNTRSIAITENSSIQSLNFGIGAGGTINLYATENLFLDNSDINSISRLSDGGNVNIMVSKMLKLTNSSITSEASLNGGNITIDPEIVILNNSTLIAKAIQGSGGNISIQTNVFLQSKNSILDASSRFGLAGSLNISVPENQNLTNLSMFTTKLPLSKDLLYERCDVKKDSPLSTLTLSNIISIPKNPASYLPYR